jgi:hypothetical protein
VRREVSIANSIPKEAGINKKDLADESDDRNQLHGSGLRDVVKNRFGWAV